MKTNSPSIIPKHRGPMPVNPAELVRKISTELLNNPKCAGDLAISTLANGLAQIAFQIDAMADTCTTLSKSNDVMVDSYKYITKQNVELQLAMVRTNLEITRAVDAAREARRYKDKVHSDLTEIHNSIGAMLNLKAKS